MRRDSRYDPDPAAALPIRPLVLLCSRTQPPRAQASPRRRSRSAQPTIRATCAPASQPNMSSSPPCDSRSRRPRHPLPGPVVCAARSGDTPRCSRRLRRARSRGRGRPSRPFVLQICGARGGQDDVHVVCTAVREMMRVGEVHAVDVNVDAEGEVEVV